MVWSQIDDFLWQGIHELVANFGGVKLVGMNKLTDGNSGEAPGEAPGEVTEVICRSSWHRGQGYHELAAVMLLVCAATQPGRCEQREGHNTGWRP